MSLEPPGLPETFNWDNLRAILDEWFFRNFRLQSSVQTGTIAAFVISTPPEGWVLTDATDYEDTKFPNLFKLIGANGAAPGFMRVPNIPADGYGTWMIKV